MEYISTLQNGLDDQKPSLFELLSEAQLTSLLPPTLRYLLARATPHRPRYLLPLLNSFDELYALLQLLIERHYLRTHGGSFVENFYGLKREKVLRIRGGEIPRARLGVPELVRETVRIKTSRDVWQNLAVMVGVPYLKRKLDESYEVYAPQAVVLGPSYARDALPPNPTIKQRILHYYKWFLRHIYPSVNAAYYFSILAFNLAYLFDSTKYHSPFLWLIGTRIRRMGEADHRAIALAASRPSPSSSSASRPSRGGARPGPTNSLFHPRTLAFVVYPRLLSSLKILLPTSIFLLKFLEWWHASDFARQLSRKEASEGVELPPPVVSQSTHPNHQTTTTTSKPKSSVSLSSSSSPPQNNTAQPHPSSSTKPTKAIKPTPPISSTSHLPIYTLPPSSTVCPICLHPIVTPTACQTGHVFCYTCIYRWVEGTHERQMAFMEGRSGGEEGWGEEDDEKEDAEKKDRKEKGGSKEGRWESGKGRCAVTGRRVLGGTDGLRRVMVG
ncbi:MAG: ubiquitin-protein ligase peroxin 12 [Caeruleum heppii]|nr:MAG: ubiquitin-protein ligase peroxin 12 [Caeruleum heppii]